MVPLASVGQACTDYQDRSEEHTSELQSLRQLVCRLLLVKKTQRLLGSRWLNPVSCLQLVEVLSHHGTDRAMLKPTLAFVSAVDRMPLPVTTLPGMLFNMH